MNDEFSSRLDEMADKWSEKVDQLQAEVERLKAENDRLKKDWQAMTRQSVAANDLADKLAAELKEAERKLAEMEGQEPVAYRYKMTVGQLREWVVTTNYATAMTSDEYEPLYTKPQPASIPEGFMLVPKERKLLGWRAENFLWETDDIAKAKNWEPNIGVLPIFEGDPNTKLAAGSQPAVQEPVGGFRYNDYHGWQQVAKEYENDADVTKLYAKPQPAPQPAQSSDELLHDRPVASSKAILEKSVRNPAQSSDAKDAALLIARNALVQWHVTENRYAAIKAIDAAMKDKP